MSPENYVILYVCCMYVICNVYVCCMQCICMLYVCYMQCVCMFIGCTSVISIEGCGVKRIAGGAVCWTVYNSDF